VKLRILFFVAMAACKSSRDYVDVPGWSCTWEDDVCTCTQTPDAAGATHKGCTPPKYEHCVVSASMGKSEHPVCECRTAGPGKLQPNDHRVSQCPPLTVQ
jgi:hypothetical protein